MARPTAILIPAVLMGLWMPLPLPSTAAPLPAGPVPAAPAAVPRVVLAEGPGAPLPKGGVFPEVEEASEEDAKALEDALEEALKSKEQETILAAIKPMVGKRSKRFVDDLRKLLGDKDEDVAAAAAAALGSQDDKSVVSTLAKIVKSAQRDRGILVRGRLKAACIESLGRLGVTALFDDIQKLAESMLDEREVKYTYAQPILTASIRYFGITKEKRAVSTLIVHVDEPAPEDPNSGTNPPAEYWKKRFEIWKEIKPEVVWALKEITGEEFETGRRWKNWLKEDGKKAGMK